MKSLIIVLLSTLMYVSGLCSMGHSSDPSDPKGYYTTLEVTNNASAPDIREAYLRLALLRHPDKIIVINARIRKENIERENRLPFKTKQALEEEFKKLVEAYSNLSDAQKRANYNATCATLYSPA